MSIVVFVCAHITLQFTALTEQSPTSLIKQVKLHTSTDVKNSNQSKFRFKRWPQTNHIQPGEEKTPNSKKLTQILDILETQPNLEKTHRLYDKCEQTHKNFYSSIAKQEQKTKGQSMSAYIQELRRKLYVEFPDLNDDVDEFLGECIINIGDTMEDTYVYEVEVLNERVLEYKNPQKQQEIMEKLKAMNKEYEPFAFVIQKGKLKASPKFQGEQAPDGLIKHSTLSNSEKVHAAGQFQVKIEGDTLKIEFMINNSGHYQPQDKNIVKAQRFIQKTFGDNGKGIKMGNTYDCHTGLVVSKALKNEAFATISRFVANRHAKKFLMNNWKQFCLGKNVDCNANEIFNRKYHRQIDALLKKECCPVENADGVAHRTRAKILDSYTNEEVNKYRELAEEVQSLWEKFGHVNGKATHEVQKRLNDLKATYPKFNERDGLRFLDVQDDFLKHEERPKLNFKDLTEDTVEMTAFLRVFQYLNKFQADAKLYDNPEKPGYEGKLFLADKIFEMQATFVRCLKAIGFSVPEVQQIIEQAQRTDKPSTQALYDAWAKAFWEQVEACGVQSRIKKALDDMKKDEKKWDVLEGVFSKYLSDKLQVSLVDVENFKQQEQHWLIVMQRYLLVQKLRDAGASEGQIQIVIEDVPQGANFNDPREVVKRLQHFENALVVQNESNLGKRPRSSSISNDGQVTETTPKRFKPDK